MSFKATRLLCRLGHGPTKTPALVTVQLKRVDGPLTVLGNVWAMEPGGNRGLGIAGMHCLKAFFLGGWGGKKHFPKCFTAGICWGHKVMSSGLAVSQIEW